MRRRRWAFRLVAFLLTCILAPGAPRAEGSRKVEEILPADTAITILVNNVASFLDALEKSPYGKLMDDPQIAALLGDAEMSEEAWDELLGELGVSTAEVRELLTGPAGVGLKVVEGSTEPEPLLVLQVSDPEKMVEIMAAALKNEQDDRSGDDDQIREIEEDFEDYTVYLRQIVGEESTSTEFTWSVAGNLYLAASRKQDLERMLRSVASEEDEESLATTASFRDVQALCPGADFLVYFSTRSFLPMLSSAMQGSLDDSPAAAMGLTPDKFLSASGLASLRSLFLAGELANDETRFTGGLRFDERKGLLRLLAYQPGAASLPRFVPGEAVSASFTRYSVSAAWEGLEETLNGLNPMMAAMVQGQLQQLLAQAGITRKIDLKKGVLAPLGDELTSFTLRSKPAPGGDGETVSSLDTVLVVSVKDRQALEPGLNDLVEVIKAVGGAFGQSIQQDEKEFLGTTIRHLSFPFFEEILSVDAYYALSDQQLLIAFNSPAALQAALVGINRPEDSLWSRPEVKAALASLPEGASSVSFAALDPLSIQEIFQQFELLLQEKDRSLPDPEKIASHFDCVVTGLYPTDKGFTARIEIQYPK